MPRYRVTMPDGNTYSIEGPAGATDEQIVAAVQRRLDAAKGGPETTLRGEIKEAVKGALPGAAGLVLDTAATGVSALLPEEQEMAVRRRAAELARSVREAELLKAAPGYEESIGRKFGEALGSTAPFFALGPFGAAGRIGALGLGAAAGAGEARQRAEMEGGEEEKGLATAGGALLGLSEAVPVFNFVKRLPQGEQLRISDRIRRALQAGGEEGAQEAAAAIGQNLIARGLYKPDQALIEGIGEEAAYGAGVGAFIQVLTDMALGRRVRGVDTEAPTTQPPGSQAAVADEVSKLAETEARVSRLLMEDEAAAERAAIQAYESEQAALGRPVEELTDEEQARLEEEALRREFEEEQLRDAAAAERMAPEEREGMELAIPTPTVTPIEEDAEIEAQRQADIEQARQGELEVADVPRAAVTTAETDIEAGGRGVTVPPSGEAAAQPSVETTELAGLDLVSDTTERADVGEGDVSAPLEAAAPTRAADLRAKAIDFVQRTGKGSAVALQKELGIKLAEAKILREALLGSGAIVQTANVRGGKPAKGSYYYVPQDLAVTEQPQREGRSDVYGRAEDFTVDQEKQALEQAGMTPFVEEEVVPEAETRRREMDAAAEREAAIPKKLPPTLKPEIGKGEYGLRYTDPEGNTAYRAFESVAERSEARSKLANEGNKNFGTFSRMAEVAKFEQDYARGQVTPAMTKAQVQKAVKGIRDGMQKLRVQLGLFTEAEAPTPQKAVPKKVSRKELVEYAKQVTKNVREAGRLKKYAKPIREALEAAERGDTDLRTEYKRLQRIDTRLATEAYEVGEAKQARIGDFDRKTRVKERGEDAYTPLDFRNITFQRGAGLGMAADRVYDTVMKVASKWPNSPRIFVVQSVKELPDTLREQVPTDSKGFYIRGDVFIIADNINSDADARATLFHESLGHFGLRSTFGTRIYQVMQDIYRTNPAMRKAADKWLKTNPGTYSNMTAERQRSMAVEEVLAEASVDGQIKDPGIRAAFNRVVSLIRQFVREMGIPLRYTNNDVRQVLIQAHDVVTTRNREQRLGDGTITFQRKQAKDRLSRVFDVNITAPEYDSKIGDGVRGALGRINDNLRDGALSFLSIPQIAEVWNAELPSVEKLDKVLSERGATQLGRREEVATNVKKWFTLSNKYKDRQPTLRKFFKVANLTTVYQVDPLSANVQAVLKKPRDQMTPFDRVAYDIVSEYNSLPTDLRTAYKELREEYEQKSRELFKLMEDRLGKTVVDKLRVKYDSKRLQVYLPLWRNGNYWMTYTDKNGETITSAYASEVDRNRARAAAEKEGGKDFQNFARLSDARSGGPPPTGFLGDVVKELEAKDAPQDMIDAVYEAFLNYIPAESVRQMYRPREASFDIATGVDRYGVFGFEPDVFQVYANVGTRIANQLTNLEYAIPLETTLEEIRQQAGGEKATRPVLASVYNNLKGQVDFIRYPDTGSASLNDCLNNLASR